MMNQLKLLGLMSTISTFALVGCGQTSSQPQPSGAYMPSGPVGIAPLDPTVKTAVPLSGIATTQQYSGFKTATTYQTGAEYYYSPRGRYHGGGRDHTNPNPSSPTCTGTAIVDDRGQCVNAIPIYVWRTNLATSKLDFLYTQAGPSCLGKSVTAPECFGETVNETGRTLDYQTPVFYAFDSNVQSQKLSRMYRMFNETLAQHFYTNDVNEVNQATAKGFVVENKFFQVVNQATAANGLKNLYRHRNNSGESFLATDASITGAVNEGIKGLVF